jgi:midasin
VTPYMDSFAFPFYIILRQIDNLPGVLADALRQWFELTSRSM